MNRQVGTFPDRV